MQELEYEMSSMLSVILSFVSMYHSAHIMWAE